MAKRKRKFPGIRGRRPDKKFARGVRAKVVKIAASSVYGSMGYAGELNDLDVYPGIGE